ncbi:MAG: hypothetical protein E7618_07040 [Ruminococcaceae bacterium]|nr:hypothetical protein [Oscillospiraceae bacterium]
MRKGTTPTHIFTLGIETSCLTDLRILYAQDDVILEKHLSDCVLEGETASVTLTEEETFLFASDAPVNIQLRLRIGEDVVLTSDPIIVPVKRCLKEEVLI